VKQLECLKCGSSWYGSQDSLSSITTDDQSNLAPSVGLAPLATSKFEVVEKELQSPRESERPPGAQESLSSPPTTKAEKVEEIPATESHYDEVERILTEPISLSGPGLSKQDQSKTDEESTNGVETQDALALN
jgi:hypothetical protein